MHELKERILIAAHELFLRYGIRSITMDDIAKHLSISKKTIYQSFKDKDEVVHELISKMLKENERIFNEVEKNSPHIIAGIFDLMNLMEKIIGQIHPGFFLDLQKYHPRTWKLFLEFKEGCVMKSIESQLTKGIQQGLIRPDIDTRILSRMRMEQIEMGFNPVVFPHDKYKVLDVQIALLDHFLHGVCTLKGHKLINKYKQITEEE